jgi:hypothetical protein
VLILNKLRSIRILRGLADFGSQMARDFGPMFTSRFAAIEILPGNAETLRLDQDESVAAL